MFDSISPSLEMGAFEALWAEDVSSFKQMRDALSTSNKKLASEIISKEIALEYYEKAMAKLANAGIDSFGVRIEGTSDYPLGLRDADHWLFLVYFIGNWELAFSPGIAVVGTRNPSEEGKRRARKLVKKLVSKDFTIYSGLAKGIDTEVHKTAIKCGGNTVAVLGTPISKYYPNQNRELQDFIAKEHLLVSQVPVVRYDSGGPKFNRFFFPERNKTMSAMTKATIIVEASETSGTLVQAKAALKQDRHVFILNSCFENQALSWPHKLEEKGAVRVRTFEDIDKVIKNDRPSPEN